MAEWQELEVSYEQQSESLSIRPETLHAEFAIQADHLHEARDRHTMLLVTAGELPEANLAEIHPMRRLAWMVDDLNGLLHPDGLTIPLHGADLDMVELSIGEMNGLRSLKLRIGSDFERIMPLPEDSTEPKATINDGKLELRY
jgi:hypothetical protein